MLDRCSLGRCSFISYEYPVNQKSFLKFVLLIKCFCKFVKNCWDIFIIMSSLFCSIGLYVCLLISHNTDYVPVHMCSVISGSLQPRGL